MSHLHRYSALPAPRGSRNGSVDDGTASGLPLPGRTSAASMRRPGSVAGASADGIPQVTGNPNRRSMLTQPSHVKTASTSSVGRQARPQSMIGGFGGVGARSPPPPMKAVQEVDTPNSLAATPVPKKSRPSLSDRTIESLSQVPPSPSPAKRRASGFYNPESPMLQSRPQSRANSSMGHRPGSRIGGPSSLPGARAASPTKRPMTSGGLKQPGLSATGRRSVSDRTGPLLPTGHAPMGLKKPGSGLQRAGSTIGMAKPPAGSARSLAATSKTIGTGPGSRSPVKDAHAADLAKPKVPGLGIKSLRAPAMKPVRPTSMIGGPGIRAQAARALPKTRKPITPPSEPTEEPEDLTSEIAELEEQLRRYEMQEDDQRQEDTFSQDETLQGEEAPVDEDIAPDEQAPTPAPELVPEPESEATQKLTLSSRKVSAPSKGLKDMIAAGRASKKVSGAFTPRVASDMDGLGITIGPDTDPNNMIDFEDNRFVNLLKKRVNAAKRDGKLNVSALGLTNIPSEILKMYDYDPDAKDGVAFYEMVEVTKLQAADNEINEIPADAFVPLPDEGQSEVEGQPVFACLESIDLHGNLLKSLPPRLAGLERLTSLNLSRNKLELDTFGLICKLPKLTDLRLSENGFKGALPACIGNLAELEVLDIHGNGITELPQELSKLNKLKRLDVHDNRLEAIPFEHIFDLPVIEILASRNRLNNALFPTNVTQIPHLQTLDVSTNALFELSESKVDLPRLQSLNISNNRVAALPDVSGWQELSTLNAEENKISAFPDGFTSLKHLKSANLSNNSLLMVDDKIGDMEGLAVLQMANNPIRERRLVRLGIEELKAELRTRLQPQQPDAVPGSPNKDRVSLFLNGMNGQSVIGSGPAWTASGGMIEKPNSKLRDIEDAHLEPLVGQGVHTMVLHHNWLPKIPQAIRLLGASLSTLDLSNNRLNKTDPFVGTDGLTLDLPHLTTLNLTSNGLTSLEPLVKGNLVAPMLATLIVPFNRIGALPTEPSLKAAFPHLTKLIAANNVISQLDAEAVRGLEVLDVSSNEIESLPPKLGALQGTLRMLMVNGNRFKVPGWGVLEKGTEEVLKWCRMKIPAGEEGSMVGGED